MQHLLAGACSLFDSMEGEEEQCAAETSAGALELK